MVLLDSDVKLHTTADGFAALGSPARLQIVRALVRAGEKGLSVGDIQSQTGIAASTLAHHLRSLVSVGLIQQQKIGRTIINVAEFEQLQALAGYILEECCADQNKY